MSSFFTLLFGEDLYTLGMLEYQVFYFCCIIWFLIGCIRYKSISHCFWYTAIDSRLALSFLTWTGVLDGSDFYLDKMVGQWIFVVFTIFYWILLPLSKAKKDIDIGIGPHPTRSPCHYLQGNYSNKKPLIVCIGDSITRGSNSADYVSALHRKYGGTKENTPWGLFGAIPESQPIGPVANAGGNGDTAFNVLNRLDEIVALQPKFFTLLIGTNDMKNLYDPALSEHALQIFSRKGEDGYGLKPYTVYKSSKVTIGGTQCGPDQQFLEYVAENPWKSYEASVKKIIAVLSESCPEAHIGVCTLPPLGEDLTSRGNKKIIPKCNALLKKIVKDTGNSKVELIEAGEKIFDTLLDLKEHYDTNRVEEMIDGSLKEPRPLFNQYLRYFFGKQQGKSPPPFLNWLQWYQKCFLFVTLFGWSYRTFGSTCGLKLMSDNLHLNEAGASIYFREISNFIDKHNTNDKKKD